MAKTVRLIDIGKKLGVSAVTVSKALSGQKGVSEEMREKIVRLADEMGYKRSDSQIESSKEKSFTIGVIVADPLSGRKSVLLLETLSGDLQMGNLPKLFPDAGSDQPRSGEAK